MKPKVLIYVHDFGPLHDQILEFAPFLLFTGHSGLGKSYANYLIYYLMRSLSTESWYGIIGKKIQKNKSAEFDLSILEVLGYLNEHVQDFMRSFLGDYELICNVEYRLEYEDKAFSPILKIEYIQSRAAVKGEGIEAFQYISLLIKVNGEEFRNIAIDDEPIIKQSHVGRAISLYLQDLIFGKRYSKSVLLPPARGALVGENYSMKDAVTSSCKMYDYFLRDYDEATRIFRPFRRNEEDNSFFTNRVKDLLHGELVSEKGIQYLLLPNNRRIPLTSAASSVKELSPFLFYLKNWSDWIFSFCIEEPEAHLHPTMQLDLADLLAACCNKGMMFQMTTHSDYFLLRINQLLRIGKLKKENVELYKEFQETNKLNRRFYLNEEDVLCYYFTLDTAGNVQVTKLPFENGVLPMNTFYSSMNQLDDFDRKLDNEFEELYGLEK